MLATRTGTTRTTTTTVVDLRPLVAARRTAALRERLMERRELEPRNRGSIAVIRDVLDRAARVSGDERDSWDRLVGLLEQHEHAPHATAACASAANLVGLAFFGDPTDHAALADLAEELGHDRLARMQHRYGAPLESHPGLPLTTEAVRRMVRSGLRDHLAVDRTTAERADSIDHACLRAAHALLQQGLDRNCTVPVLDSTEELLDIARRGTVVEWRHHLAMITADAWSPYTSRLVELAQAAGHTHAATVIAALIDLCRDAASPATDATFARWVRDTPRAGTYPAGHAWAPVAQRRSRAALVAERRARLAAPRRRALKPVAAGRSRQAAG